MVVRTAVVGAGTVSRRHLEGVRKNPGMELVGVCDLDETAASRMAREFETRAMTDLESLFEADVDSIHVCTPVQTHFDIARRAIEAGVAVLIEKPATTTVGEIEELAELARERDVPATVVHNHLFDLAVRKARQLISAGELGELRSVSVTYAGLTPPDTENRGSWVFDLPGGEFEEGLPHPLYAALGVGGFPASMDDVSAQTVRSREYEDGFSYDQAQLQYVSEADTLCHVTMLSGTQPQRLHVIHGTDQSLLVDEVNQSLYRIDENYMASTIARSKKAVDVSLAQVTSAVENATLMARSQLEDSWAVEARTNSHFALFDQFARAVEYGEAVPVPLEQAIWTTRLMEAIRESADRRESRADAVTAPERTQH